MCIYLHNLNELTNELRIESTATSMNASNALKSLGFDIMKVLVGESCDRFKEISANCWQQDKQFT